MHLFGFIIRIYRDARSPERQICTYSLYCLSSLDITKAKNRIFTRSTNISFHKLSSLHGTETSESTVPCIVKHPQITNRKLNKRRRFLSNSYLYFPNRPSWPVLWRNLLYLYQLNAAIQQPSRYSESPIWKKFCLSYKTESVLPCFKTVYN